MLDKDDEDAYDSESAASAITEENLSPKKKEPEAVQVDKEYPSDTSGEAKDSSTSLLKSIPSTSGSRACDHASNQQTTTDVKSAGKWIISYN